MAITLKRPVLTLKQDDEPAATEEAPQTEPAASNVLPNMGRRAPAAEAPSGKGSSFLITGIAGLAALALMAALLIIQFMENSEYGAIIPR